MKKYPLKNICYYLFLLILMLTQLLLMYFFLGKTSIDNDDMCQLEVSISHSLPRIFELLLETDNNPPLFTLLAAVWIRIMPYGSGSLKLLSQLFLVAATGLMGFYSCKISGYLSGVITAVMTASSTLLIYCCANVFRPYGLLFLTGAITLCAYLHRRRHDDNTASLILYWLAITSMAYTHYFGILTCLALFLFDVILFFKNKARIMVVVPYMAAGLCYLTWLVPVAREKLASAASFWPTVPTLINLYTNCYKKYFDSNLNILVFVIFMVVLCRTQYKNRLIIQNTKLRPEENYPDKVHPRHAFTLENLALCLWVPFFVTILDFVYSAILNPAGSMWVERYFIVLYPFSFLLIGISWSYLAELLIDKWDFTIKKWIPYLVISAYLLLQGYQFYNTCVYMSTNHTRPYEQACDYLVEQEDFFEEKTGFLPTFNHQKKAYRYYFTHKGTRSIPDFNWIAFPVEDASALEAFDTIYLLEIFIDMDKETLSYLESQFTRVEEPNSWGVSKWVRKQ